MPRRKQPGRRIGRSSDRIATDAGNARVQSPVVEAPVVEAPAAEAPVAGPAGAIPDVAALRAELSRLQALVEVAAGPQVDRARARLRDLEEALTPGRPDVTTLAYVRDWFGRHLPALAGAVGSVIMHPAAAELVAAAGEEPLREFRRHFGQPRQR